MVTQKRLPKGSRLATAIAISPSNQFIAASDAAEKICAYLFKMDGDKNPIASVGINMKVVHLEYSPLDDNMFATAGAQHMMLCTVNGATIKAAKGKSKGGQVQSQSAVAFSCTKKGVAYSGGADGKVYQWNADQVVKTYDNNKGQVTSVACRKDDKIGELVIAGGSDKSLSLY